MTLPMPYPTILPPTCAQSVPVDVHSSINPRKRRRSESGPRVSINIPEPASVSTHAYTYSSSSSSSVTQQQQHSKTAAAATLVTPPLSPPDESSFEATRAKYVESLIATTTRLLETLWPSPTTTPPPTYQLTCSTRLTPLPQVISSLLRRSRTSCSTLHLSLLYLVRLRNAVVGRKSVRDRIRSFSSSTSSSTSATHNLKHHPLLCPRRSFLTSLILAHKYLNDKALSNGAWARISGLAVGEINLAEREFLICVGYEVGVKEGVWERWCRGVGGWMRGSSSHSPTVTAAVGASAVCKDVGEVERQTQPVLVVPGGKVQPSVTLTPQSEAGSESDGEGVGSAGSEAVFEVPLVLGYDVVVGREKRVRIV